MSIFEYDFMRKALFAAVLIALAAPCIGVVIVLKRLSGIGESASHSALGGVAFGLAFGIDPLLGAIIFSLAAMLGIEGFRKAFARYSEIATTVVMSAGIGLTALFSGMIKSGTANLNSFMFGSIASVGDYEIFITAGLSAAVLIVTLILYKELFFITFDEEAAHLAGVPVGKINFAFMVLTAITVSAASRIVGALMIASLMVIPVACAMVTAKSYKQTMIQSVCYAELFTVAGLVISYYSDGVDLRPGGTIVILGVIVLIAVLALFGRKNK